MVDLRKAAKQLDVRVAATPSYYPSVLAFPPGTVPGLQNPRVIPPIGVLGFHSFSWITVTDVGPASEGAGGHEIWYRANATMLPEEWEFAEKRILRLPPAITSADVALAYHQKAILTYILEHGDDAVPITPAPHPTTGTAFHNRGGIHALAPQVPGTTGIGRSGGGDAPSYRPSGIQPRGPGAPATLPATAAPALWPKDELGCFIIPPFFPAGHYSYVEWQTYWGSRPSSRTGPW